MKNHGTRAPEGASGRGPKPPIRIWTKPEVCQALCACEDVFLRGVANHLAARDRADEGAGPPRHRRLRAPRGAWPVGPCGRHEVVRRGRGADGWPDHDGNSLADHLSPEARR